MITASRNLVNVRYVWYYQTIVKSTVSDSFADALHRTRKRSTGDPLDRGTQTKKTPGYVLATPSGRMLVLRLYQFARSW
jgi:hypothetical protein